MSIRVIEGNDKIGSINIKYEDGKEKILKQILF